MSREGLVSRRTATRYIEAAKVLRLGLSTELTDQAVRDIAARVQTRPSPAQRVRIEKWLQQDQPLTRVRVRELWARDGTDMSYTTLRRWAQSVLGYGRRCPTVRVDDPPAGEEAQVDFGLMSYVAATDGHRCKLHVLIVTRPMSRYQFVWPTFLQTTQARCEGLDAAWRFFGGVTHRQRHRLPAFTAPQSVSPMCSV